MPQDAEIEPGLDMHSLDSGTAFVRDMALVVHAKAVEWLGTLAEVVLWIAMLWEAVSSRRRSHLVCMSSALL